MATETTAVPEVTPILDQERLQHYMDNLRLEQNFLRGALAGMIGAILAAVVWAAITVFAGFQHSLMAVVVGIFVGAAVQLGGKGLSFPFGLLGGALALAGCVLGNILAIYGYIANRANISFFNLLSRASLDDIQAQLVATFDPIDLAFYAGAVYAGYRFAFRQIADR